MFSAFKPLVDSGILCTATNEDVALTKTSSCAGVRRCGSDDAELLDAFVGPLLTVVGYSGRPTDGVQPSWENYDNGGAFGFGLAVMAEDPLVEPLRVQLRLDAFGSVMDAPMHPSLRAALSIAR